MAETYNPKLQFADEATRVVSAKFADDPTDTALGHVTFLIESDTPEKARDAASEVELINEGQRIARKEGMEAPCLSDHGVARACDKDGTPNKMPMETMDAAEAGRKYYCSIMYAYRGDQ
jgi:hypothetical protein